MSAMWTMVFLALVSMAAWSAHAQDEAPVEPMKDGDLPVAEPVSKNVDRELCILLLN